MFQSVLHIESDVTQQRFITLLTPLTINETQNELHIVIMDGIIFTYRGNF